MSDYLDQFAGTMFDVKARARNTDPETSHQAAASLRADKLRASQTAVLETLRRFPQGLTDPEIAEAYIGPDQSTSGLRTRRSELRDAGLIADSGERRTLVSGRKAIVWKAL